MIYVGMAAVLALNIVCYRLVWLYIVAAERRREDAERRR